MNNSSIEKRKLKILFVSTSYPSDEKDWRGRFTANLVKALSLHRDLSLEIWAPPGKLPSNVGDAAFADDKIWMEKMMAQGGIAHILRTRGLGAAGVIGQLLLKLRNVYRRSSDFRGYTILVCTGLLCGPHHRSACGRTGIFANSQGFSAFITDYYWDVLGATNGVPMDRTRRLSPDVNRHIHCCCR